MSYYHDEKIFINSIPNILSNENIRKPQLQAYCEIIKYFRGEYENRNALVVLPTGVGKTGVMALAPFSLCSKRTLIITPGTTIRNTVIDSLNPENPDNFWYKTNVFQRGFPLPNVIEYDGNNTPKEVLNAANIVILNIQKLQSRLDSSLIHKVDNDFFDFIIIDEAHHSTATTWIECINYFKNAKILKLTGTPFRTDGDKITGNLIYKYSLGRAMSNNFVKSLSNIQYVPKELKLTIDNNVDKLYTLDEIYSLGLRDEDWVSRSVAYSIECSEAIVDESINSLEDKKSTSNVPHKIIAIACSIEHAKQIATLYENKGIKTTIIHSELPKDEKEKAFKDIENHRVEAVINVAMLGEGYDHPYLSIAAIFRPFRNELPYVQFIGRILRFISEGSAKDNVGIIISHKHLNIDHLWNKYKKEIQESEIIKSLKDYEDILEDNFNSSTTDSNTRLTEPLGNVIQSNSHTIDVEDYLTTELLEKSKKEDENLAIQIEQMKKILPNLTDEQAKLIIQQGKNASNPIGRPDLLYKRKRSDLDTVIREELVPKLIESNNISKDKSDLEHSNLFIGKYWYIPNILKNKKNNAALLALYYNNVLKDRVGLPRNKWLDSDLDNAFNYLDKLTAHIDGIIKLYYNRNNK